MKLRFSPFARAGFTLVEVTLAIGVVAVAFVSLFALLPTGLGLFRQAMDASIGSQISQQVVGEAQQADFDALVPASGTGGAGNQFFEVLPLRYFDDQGTELDVANKPALKPRVLYTVRTRGSMPGAADPSSQSGSCFTTVPSTLHYGLRETTFLAVQVIINPGASRDVEAAVDSTQYLITPTTAKKHNFQVQTFTAVVARNGFRKSSNSTSP